MVLDKSTMKGMKLFRRVRLNEELRLHEVAGFVRGAEKGKKMNVQFHVVTKSLEKQWKDWQKARLSSDPYVIKKALADLRNVAGCAFLILQELEQK